MKIRRRALSILLTMVMVFTFMPAMAFAGGVSSQKPVGLEFKGDLEYAKKFVQEDYNRNGFSYAVEDIYAEGNRITVKYSDHSVEYEPRRYQYPGETEEDGYSLGFFPVGEATKIEKDESGYYYTVNNADVDYEIDLNGQVKIMYRFSYSYTDEDGYEMTDYDEISTTVQAKEYNEPVSVTYSGPALTYEPWSTDKHADFLNEGAKITVKYKDGSTKTAVCRMYGTSKVDGESYDEFDYFWEGEEPVAKTGEGGWLRAENGLNSRGFLYSEAKGDDKQTITYEEYFYNGYFSASVDVPKSQKVYPYPKSATFVPAKGFQATALIGQQWFDASELYGKGNKIVMTWSDGTKETYKYGKYTQKGVKEKIEGFAYKDKDGYVHEVWPVFNSVKGFKKGTTTLTAKISTWPIGYEKEYKTPLKVKVKASKYLAQANFYTYPYTGKTVTPKKVEVYAANDKGKMKKLSSSKYTYKVKKGKKIGSYSFKINFKSKADQKKYGKSIKCYYAIVPKTPTGVKVTAGSKSLTVKWKKMSNVDGYEVYVSKYKNFRELSEWVSVKKSKTSATIKNLEKGKTYYVYVTSVKNGVVSNPSKKVSKKTK